MVIVVPQGKGFRGRHNELPSVIHTSLFDRLAMATEVELVVPLRSAATKPHGDSADR